MRDKNMKHHTEVLVIGGGIIGAAIAYYVAKNGHDVTIVEKNEVASGTSSRCDGNILAIDKDPGFDSQMSRVSQQLVEELRQELGNSFEYRCLGSILVCENEEEMIAAEKWVTQQKAAGLPFRMLDRQDIRQESAFFAEDLPGGLECKTDSTVNPYLLTYALIEGAKQHGAKLFIKTEVQRIEKDNHDQLFRVQTSSSDITAKMVINAAGVWAPRVNQLVGVDLPIQPRKGHLIIASRNQPLGLRKVMEFGYLMSKFGGERSVDKETEKYGVALVFEPTESQNFLIGSSREFVGLDTRVDMDVILCMARRAQRFYPRLTDMNFIRTYAGLRPWTPDHLPIVSHIDEVPGFYVAAGHEGDGISLAAVTGKVISQMIEEQEETIIPTEPLRYNRFKKSVMLSF
jgi:glycine/D-amino acid oxidase-like deaminating enzyme